MFLYFEGIERASAPHLQMCDRRLECGRCIQLDRICCRWFLDPGLWVMSIFFATPANSYLSNHADGAARVGATLFGELLNAVFANIGQRTIRKVARETFEHLLNLDLKFHLSRQTGGLTRAIDRGTKSVKQ
jgi:hypothetical protein